MQLWPLCHCPTIHLCHMTEPTSTMTRSSSDPNTNHSPSTSLWSRNLTWSSDVGQYNRSSIEISVSTWQLMIHSSVQFCPCSQSCPSKMKPALQPRRGPTGRVTPATSAASWAAPRREPAPPASASAVSVNILILYLKSNDGKLFINSQLYVWGNNECERDIFPKSGIFLNIQRVKSGKSLKKFTDCPILQSELV